MKALLVSQTSSEDLASFNNRLNEELARLGATVQGITMTCALHESMIAGRVAIPRLLHSVLVTYQDGQQ